MNTVIPHKKNACKGNHPFWSITECGIHHLLCWCWLPSCGDSKAVHKLKTLSVSCFRFFQGCLSHMNLELPVTEQPQFFSGKPILREVRGHVYLYTLLLFVCLINYLLLHLQKQTQCVEHSANLMYVLCMMCLCCRYHLCILEAIGEPYVRMVDMHNSTDVERALIAVCMVSVYVVQSAVWILFSIYCYVTVMRNADGPFHCGLYSIIT